MNWRIDLPFRVFHAAACSALLLSIGGCGYHEPFKYVKVQGKVTYEDGTVIPAQRLTVRFVSMTPASDPKMTPRPGDGVLDPKTGEFTRVTSHSAGDGILRGKHKVLILGGGDLVPAKYVRVETTPLEVDAKDSPFNFTIEKP